MKHALLLTALSASLFLATARQARADQEYCREFTREVMVGGQAQPGYGIACQQPDGSWKIVSDSNPQEAVTQGAPYNGPTTRIIQSAPDTVIVRPSRVYEAQSYGYGYGVGVGSHGTSISVGTSYYPYYGYPYPRYRYGRDPHRDHFYNYHHGPGWDKHYEHHRRVLNKE